MMDEKHPIHGLLNPEQIAAAEKLRREIGDVLLNFTNARPVTHKAGKTLSDSVSIAILASAITLGIQINIATASGIDPRTCSALTQLGVSEGAERVGRASLEVEADVELAELLKREGKMN